MTISFPRSKALPDSKTMTKNALGAAARLADALVRHRPVYVSEDVYKSRMRTCEGCQFYNSKAVRCVRCGCYLKSLIVGKARLQTESCPIGKW